MARPKKTTNKPERKPAKKPIEQYEHADKKRKNNPPVGLEPISKSLTEHREPYEAYDTEESDAQNPRKSASCALLDRPIPTTPALCSDRISILR